MVWKEEGSSSMDSWEKTAVLISQEIRDWSEQIIEIPSEEHGGLAPCPFARNAWLKENVMIHVTQDIEDIIELKALYPPTSDNMHIVAWTDYNELSVEEFGEWLHFQNIDHFGVWMTGFHPNAEGDETIPEYNGLGADDYAIILMQSYEHLVSSSRRLLRTPYYRRYSPEDLKHISERQEKFDAWNEKVNAKAYEQGEEEALQKRVEGGVYEN